jgi:hypothetical protein
VDNDDGIRPAKGVVVSLLDLGDGTSRIIMDDVSSDAPIRETSWKHEWFYTHKRVDSKLIDDMALSDDQFKGIGIALVARLLALSERAK